MPRVGGKPFANLVEPFVVRRARKQAAAFAPESQRIGDCLGPLAPARLERPAERPPFEPYPDAPFERIEMLVEAVAVSLPEPQLGLNAMEQPVKHILLPCIGIAREHIQGKAEPSHPAPSDWARPRYPESGVAAPPVPAGLWHAFRSLVKDHHRTTERHTPQPARVSLAELGGLLEPSLRELWLDLCIPQPLRRRAARVAADC
jgi:hypothetical protein